MLLAWSFLRTGFMATRQMRRDRGALIWPSFRRPGDGGGSDCPVQPIGADGLAVEDHSQGWRLRHRAATATGGSALYCDLERREDERHGGRARPLLAGAVSRPALRREPAACGSGADRPAVASRPSGLPPERARHEPTPYSTGVAIRSLGDCFDCWGLHVRSQH